MQILQVKTSADFNNAQVTAGTLLVWPEMTDNKAVFHCKDANGNVQQISGFANKNCVLLSPDAVAVGLDNISGGYSAKVTAYDAVTKTLTLSSADDYALEEDKYTDGADIYVAIKVLEVNGVQKNTIVSKTVNYATDGVTVESVDIVLDAVLSDPTGGATEPAFDSESSHWIAIVEWPDSDVTTQAEGQGNVVSGESTGTNGSYNLNTGICSHVYGIGNILIGHMGTVSGNGNVAIGNSLDVVGTGNNVSGNFVAVNGSQNEVTGDLHFIFGSMNQITGDNVMVWGNSNQTYPYIRETDDGTEISVNARNVTVIGMLNEVTAYQTRTIGYRLKNEAKFAVMLGRDAELSDDPGNEAAFVIGGGKFGTPVKSLAVYSRRKILNPLYNPVNDPDGNGVDSDGEVQYLNQLGFKTVYKGHLLGITYSETVNVESGTQSVSLDHDLFARWKITPTGAGQITFSCDYWEDGDEGTLIIYNGNGKVSFPAEWTWIGSAPTLTTDGYDVFTIMQVDNDIIIKHEVSK